MSKKNGHPSVLDIPVDFGGVSIGQSTVRLAITVARAQLNLLAADEAFVGHRLACCVLLGHVDDMPGQSRLFDSDIQVDGQADVKGIRVTADSVSTGLTFSLPDIDIATLAKFSKGKGRLIVTGVFDIPDDAASDDDEDEEDETLRTDAPWRKVSLSTLFDGSLLKKLNAAGLDTVGKLSDYTASDKRLNDIDGIGSAAEQKIEDRMLQFWKANPQEEPVGA